MARRAVPCRKRFSRDDERRCVRSEVEEEPCEAEEEEHDFGALGASEEWRRISYRHNILFGDERWQ